MGNRFSEEQHLLVANRHIDEARRRIAHLAAHVDRFRANGTSAPDAERLLCLMRDASRTMILHRKQIEREIEDQRGRLDKLW